MIKFSNIVKFFKVNVFKNKNEKNYINYNKKKWLNYKNNYKDVILLDLFPFNPWIHFYSYISNLLSKKLKAKTLFFYFDLYQGNQSKIELFISKLKSIYFSFNVEEGISEYKFVVSKNEKKKYDHLFSKINFDRKKLANYKYKNIKIGDLIYDTYLRIYYVPTIKINDIKLKKIFFRAHKIFDEVEKFFKCNNVKCVIPSHVCYINFGIISRIAFKNKIPIIKIFSKNRGNASYRILKVDSNHLTEEPPYFNYKKTFKKFNNKLKLKALKIGKKSIEDRISGSFDPNLPYMTVSSFNNKKFELKSNSQKKKIIIFPHCYFDNPHRYRFMIFDDFYLQVKYFLDLSKEFKNYDWYYKPHPNELRSELNVHKNILSDYPNVKYLDKDISHKDILKLKPSCVITNHGTLSHEYAYFKIPVINTGDNPHINYKFCLHLKSKKQIRKVIKNIDTYKKKINFDRKEIYQYMYLHYHYFPNLNEEDKLLNDKYFAFKNIKRNNTTEIFSKFIRQGKNADNNIKMYVEKFINKNL